MSNIEILNACVYKNEACERTGTIHSLGCIPGTRDGCERRGYHGDGKTLGNVHNHQVNSTISALHSFEGTSLIRLVLYMTNKIQN
jgi:hypothetical protein